jgi:hypothetical protein
VLGVVIPELHTLGVTKIDMREPLVPAQRQDPPRGLDHLGVPIGTGLGEGRADRVLPAPALALDRVENLGAPAATAENLPDLVTESRVRVGDRPF